MTDPKQHADRVPASPPPQFSPWTQIPSALIVIAAFIAVAEWKPDLVWQALVAVALAALLLHLHRLESLKIGTSGLEAKMLQSIQEADEKIDELKKLDGQLRELAKPFIRAGLLQLSWGRLAGGIKSDDRQDLRDHYETLTDNLGLRDAVLTRAFDDVRRMDAREVLDRMLRRARRGQLLDERHLQQLEQLQQEALHATPTTDVVKEVVAPSFGADPEMEELLRDYDYYLQHHRHRRPDAYW